MLNINTISFWHDGTRYEFVPARALTNITRRFLEDGTYWSEEQGQPGVWYKETVAFGLIPCEGKYVPTNRQAV